MADYETLKQKVQALAEKSWDAGAIKDWFHKLHEEGIQKDPAVPGNSGQ